MPDISLWPLLGIAVVMLGFLCKFNPVLVVTVAAFATGMAVKMPIQSWLESLGAAFLKTRNLPLILLLPLAVIGLLERHGLREKAQSWIQQIKAATTGRLLLVYLALRESTAAAGLTSLGGHPQMVRPLLSPMAEAAFEQQHQSLPDKIKYKIRAMSAATDNIGLFFGEDIFVAFGAIILMHTFLRESGIETDPLHIALWGIPTAIAAFLIHGTRLLRFDAYLARQLKHELKQAPSQEQRHD